MVDLLVNGIILGSIITLGAMGVTLIADILNFFNFAHGAMFTLGAYLAFFFKGILPNWPSFPSLSFGPALLLAALIAMIVTSLVAIFVDRVLYKRLRHKGASAIFLALSALGVAFMIRSLIQFIWGSQIRYYSSGLQMAKSFPLGITIRPDEFFILGAVVVLMLVVFLLLRFTSIGKAMRAASDNKVLAELAGIETDHVVLFTWTLGASLAAAAGILYGIQVQLRPIMGWNFLIPIFVAVVVAGVGDLWGAMAGAMIIGISQELLTGVLQNLFNALSLDVQMSVYKHGIAFMLMVLVLLFRPQGIFGHGE